MSKRSFPTKTLWNIMEPVSQKAANLVILHDDACAGKALPDLTNPVSAVVAAVSNLLTVCSSLLESSCDEILLKEMPLACQGVDESGKGLLDAAQLLKESPTSDDGRRLLARHIHGLLSSLMALLFAWDDSEIRQAVSKCQAFIDYLSDNLRLVQNESNLRAFNSSVSAALTSLTKRVRVRAEDLIAEHRCAVILSSCQRLTDLWRRLAGVLASSAPSCVTREKLANGLVSEAERLICELLADDSGVAIPRLQTGAVAWIASMQAGERAEARAVWELIRSARHIAGSRHDATEHALIVRLADEVEALFAERAFGLTPLREKWSETMQDKVSALVRACEATDVDCGSDVTLLDDVQRFLCADEHQDLEEMLAVVRNDSLTEDERQMKFSAARQKFATRCDDRIRTAERLAAEEARKDIKDRRLAADELLRLREVARALRFESDFLQESCGKLAMQPDDVDAQKAVSESEEAWRSSAVTLREIVQKAGGVPLMVVVEAAVEQSAQLAITAAQEKDSENGQQQVDRVATLSQWAIDAAQTEAQQHDDETLRAKVKAVVDGRTFTSESLRETGREMMNREGDAASTETWKRETDNAVTTIKSLRRTFEGEQECGEKRQEQTATEDAESVPERSFDFPEPKEDEGIMRAAYDLHSAASFWESTGNSLVTSAKRAAILLGELHAAAQSGGNRKALIQTAEQLHLETANIVKEAMRIANNCTDKRIKKALMDLCARLTTHNQQFKVVTAVKAAAKGVSDESVDEAYEALSTNAETLYRGIADTLSMAEAASVRIRVDSGGVMRWVRQRG